MKPGTLILCCCILLTGCGFPSVRLMTYNIHHGRGIDGRVDLRRIAEVIRAADVDVVALNEVDKGTRRTQGRDLAGELAAMLGMTAVFERNIDFQGGEYGNALLSRLPITGHRNQHFAMLRPNEQRGLLQVGLRVDGIDLRVLVTHIDHRPDDSERVSCVAEMLAIEAAGGAPIVLCGDFNDVPGSRTHAGVTARFVDAWGAVGEGEEAGFTYPSPAPVKRIDYVFLQKDRGLHPVSASIPKTDASDHLPLVVEFELRPTRAP